MRGTHGGRAEPAADGDGVRAPNARRYEALGRVMAALACEAEMLEACRDLAWWRGADHSWHVEWRDGPYAAEVAALLADRVGEPDQSALAVPAGPATVTTAALDVMGVSFVLRAIDPLGMERLRARPGLWRLSAALDGAGGGARAVSGAG
ncbi:hypothetical protein, partial [Microbispora sp. ATCC PTA-5024]|uniref:hypothetical protein n=1 Tax=Microbispora sp. ATCC PTA-5024 TaxID=316330 RepID=UPI0018DE3C61